MNKCEYCESEFKNELSLKKHQKTAKYCLKKQKEINDDYEEIFMYANTVIKNLLQNIT